MKKSPNKHTPHEDFEMTQQDIANVLGNSRKGVSLIEERALKKAREFIEARMKKQDILPD